MIQLTFGTGIFRKMTLSRRGRCTRLCSAVTRGANHFL